MSKPNTTQNKNQKHKNRTLRHKGETGKLDFIKINFCSSEDTTKEVEKQPTEWEKNICNHTLRKAYKLIRNKHENQ